MATGFITAPPAMAGPLAGVGTDTFDGNGGCYGHCNSKPKRQHSPGDRNGHIQSESRLHRYLHDPRSRGNDSLFFVIADSGNEIQAICIDPASSSPTSSGGNFQWVTGEIDGF